jgi:multidrug transporter EmrE-like cation transporter
MALFLAGMAEIGWPIGLKMSQSPGQTWPGVILSLISFAVSGGLLWFAQKEIPIGTAYAVWTGIALLAYIRTLHKSSIDTITKLFKFTPTLFHPILQHKPPSLNLI